MSTATATPGARTKKPRSGPSRKGVLLSVAAWVIALLFVAPVLWMILTSFHSEADAATNPPSFFAPISTEGYQTFLDAGPWPPLLNSMTASVVSTVLCIVLALPAAYALSIKPVEKWTDVLFFFLSTKMLPIVAAIMPIYLFASKLQVLDNIWALTILYTAMNLPIAVWMMRSFFLEVPFEIVEAARVDGAGLFREIVRVVLPIVLPGVAAAALICFIFSWNELLLARVLTGVVAGTAPVFLTGFVSGQGLFLAQVCAAAVVISLPVLFAGFAAQDKLVQGLSLGAVK